MLPLVCMRYILSSCKCKHLRSNAMQVATVLAWPNYMHSALCQMHIAFHVHNADCMLQQPAICTMADR